VKRMRTAQEVLREQQWQVRSGDSDDPPSYKVGDWVWMSSRCRRCGQAMENHTYKVERSGQVSVQNEARLKPYWVSPDAAGQAPPFLEPARRPTMRGRGMAYRDVEELLPDQEGTLSTRGFKKPLVDKYPMTLYFNFWIDMLIRSGVIRGALRPFFYAKMGNF